VQTVLQIKVSRNNIFPYKKCTEENGLGENMEKSAKVRLQTRGGVPRQSLPLLGYNREGLVANYSYSSLAKTVTLINLLAHENIFI
jgi:hypothetical protein